MLRYVSEGFLLPDKTVSSPEKSDCSLSEVDFVQDSWNNFFKKLKGT